MQLYQLQDETKPKLETSFRQKEKMRFKDTTTAKNLAEQKRMQMKNDKLNMDGHIANHMMKQRTKKDFSVSFKFNEPIKHLPKELMEI